MYETWLRQYSSTSYALVLDTRDTFFQRDPFCFCVFFLLPSTRLALHAVAAAPRLRAAAAASVDGVRGRRGASTAPIAATHNTNPQETMTPYIRRFAWPDLKRRRRDPDHAKDLYVYEENGHKTVGSCRWNRGWLKGCFPNMPSDPSAPVRCSGSTMGSRDAMLTYVDAMLAASDEFHVP